MNLNRIISNVAIGFVAVVLLAGCATLRGDQPEPTTRPVDPNQLTEQQELEIQAARAAAWTFLPPPFDALGAVVVTLVGIKLATRKRKPTPTP
jgi:hypothetical protein